MMSLTRWDPFRDAWTLRQAMDRMFDESLRRPWRIVRRRQEEATLPIDMYETGENIVIQARIPGMRTEDVDITMLGEAVTIKGHLLSDADKEGAEDWCWHYHELWHGPFSRTVELPGPVQADQAEAHFDNGLLTLIIPKAEEAKARVIKVCAE